MPARVPASPRIRFLQITVVVAVSLTSYILLTAPIGLRPTTQSLDVGDVAQSTIQAPRDIEYVSEIRTEEARTAAESSVQPAYSKPDPAIARQQIERLQTVLQNITAVRDNVDLTKED